MRKDVELFRILSALGVIWFHSGLMVGREVAFGGLIYFIVVSTYFAAVSVHPHRLVVRVTRLLIPWVLWSMIYALVNLATKGRIFADACSGGVGCILTSPSIHLWFLPYLFALLALIDASKLVVSKRVIGITSGIVAAALLLLAPLWRDVDYLVPMGQYIHALPAALIGVFLGCYAAISATLRRAILAAILSSIALMVYLAERDVGVTYLAGVAPALLLLGADPLKRLDLNPLPLSSLMFGVYLVHILFIRAATTIGISGYSLPFVVFLVSTLAVFSIKHGLPIKGSWFGWISAPRIEPDR